jgi:hypothetical protein
MKYLDHTYTAKFVKNVKHVIIIKSFGQKNATPTYLMIYCKNMQLTYYTNGIGTLHL